MIEPIVIICQTAPLHPTSEERRNVIGLVKRNDGYSSITHPKNEEQVSGPFWLTDDTISCMPMVAKHLGSVAGGDILWSEALASNAIYIEGDDSKSYFYKRSKIASVASALLSPKIVSLYTLQSGSPIDDERPRRLSLKVIEKRPNGPPNGWLNPIRLDVPISGADVRRSVDKNCLSGESACNRFWDAC